MKRYRVRMPWKSRRGSAQGTAPRQVRADVIRVDFNCCLTPCRSAFRGNFSEVLVSNVHGSVTDVGGTVRPFEHALHLPWVSVCEDSRRA